MAPPYVSDCLWLLLKIKAFRSREDSNRSLSAAPHSFMARSARSARPDNCLGFDFQSDVIVTNVFIKFKIRWGGTGDKPRSTTERQVLECPLDENQKPILKGDEIHHVDTRPYDPGKYA